MDADLSKVDYAVIAVYVVAPGLYFTKRQKSLDEYFLASGNMPWWAVAISLYATLLSPVSFLGVVGWIFLKDSRYYFGVTVPKNELPPTSESLDYTHIPRRVYIMSV